MHATLLSTATFSGWDALERELAAWPAPELAVHLAQVVIHVADTQDGVFTSLGDLAATNLHVIQRLLLERWQREGWRELSARENAHLTGGDPVSALSQVLRSISGARNTHPALSRAADESAGERVVRGLWFTALEQRFQNRSAKHEIARAWVMFNDLWPELVRDKRTKIPPPYQTAFASLPYVLCLLMPVLHAHGYVGDVRALFEQTRLRGEVLETFLTVYTDPAEEVLAKAPARTYPGAFLTPFGEHPILRIDERRLIAPDPSAMFGGLAYRLLRQSLTSAMESSTASSDRAFREVSSTFGLVFEAYCRRLCAILTEAFIPEFSYSRAGTSVDTADGFVLESEPLIFEFKAMRFPFDVEQSWRVSELSRWLTELTGGKDGRGAFDQGVTFLRDVAAGLCPPLPRSLPGDALYVIVAYEDVPAFVHWSQIRERLWPTGSLSPEAEDLADRTIFISMRDLETAASAAELERAQGRGFDIGALLRSWRTMIRRGPTASDGQQERLPDRFGDFLLRRYAVADHFLALHRDAWQRAQDATLDVGL